MTTLPELAVLVPKLPNTGRNIVFKADQHALMPIRDELQVERLTLFQAKLLARPWKKGGLSLKGNVTVHLEQACVVTSEPVADELNIEIDRKFLPAGKSIRQEKLNDEGELVIDPDAFDFPDEFQGDTIDLWAALLEEVVLGLNPFPRIDGAEIAAEYQADEATDIAADETHNPFSELNTLINKKNSEN